MSGPLTLLTGATGFVGGRLATRMAAQGQAVRCLVRPGSDRSALERLGFELAEGDLRDRGSLDAAARGCERIVHCAALVSDWATVAEITAANVDGTAALLGAARRAGARRFVHLSTTDVYGHPGAHETGEETAPARFANWYARSKLEAEALVRAAGEKAAATAPLETVVLRPATVYGPGSREVVLEIARALRRRQMLLIDGGRHDAGLVYVENLCDAILLALGHDPSAGRAAPAGTAPGGTAPGGTAPGETAPGKTAPNDAPAGMAAPAGVFNVSDGLSVTWRRFTDDLAAGLGCRGARLNLPYRGAAAIGLALEQGYRLARRATGVSVPPLLSRQAVQVLGIDQSFSSARARAGLGWQPRVGYGEGLERTLAWLRQELDRP